MALLERAVQTTQQRLIGRVLRNNTAFRRALAPAALAEALKHFLPADEPLREHGLRVLAEVRNALLGIGVVVGSVRTQLTHLTRTTQITHTNSAAVPAR